MNFKKTKIAYFSPTGTTEKIIRSIVKGFGCGQTDYLNITQPENREIKLLLEEDEILFIGVPVYMGRVPALLEDFLNSMKADSTPTVCVAVYGNRAYDNALLELTDIVKERGCVPIAGAAFIGEHSFSSPERPTAHSRPDANDLAIAEQFGREVRKKTERYSDLQEQKVKVPGTTPYNGVTQLWDVDFIEVSNNCIQCGMCAEICPQNAVDPHDSHKIDTVKCITCCACIKKCPENARSIKSGPVMDAAERLTSLYSERKEPECFI